MARHARSWRDCQPISRHETGQSGRNRYTVNQGGTMVYLVWTLAGVYLGAFLAISTELSVSEQVKGGLLAFALYATACLVTFA